MPPIATATRAVGRARVVGPGGLLTGLTKTALEIALKAELTEHLGYEAHSNAGCDR